MKPEILAPAGSLEKLKIAIDFGADAVYIGGGRLNLRAFSDNFTNEEIAEGVKYCHDRGAKLYVTMNVFPRNHDLTGVEEYIKGLADLGIDAIIVADPSIVVAAKEAAPNLEVHISTQANITNWKAVKFWYEQGCQRIVLARELTFKEIKTIRENIPAECELEAFVHGSMCVAYSGRCLISNYMLGRDANKGICSNAFKIEGRMKSEFYVASVVKAYREAIDSYMANPEGYEFKDEWMHTLTRISHRNYHTGFYYGKMGEQNYDESSYIRDYDIVGIVQSYDEETKTATILQKNRVFEGDEVEVLRAHTPDFNVKLEDMFDLDKKVKTNVANRAMMSKRII